MPWSQNVSLVRDYTEYRRQNPMSLVTVLMALATLKEGDSIG